MPEKEAPWGYDIHHPRHLVTPVLGMRTPPSPHRPIRQDSLAQAAHVICVCQELGRVASELGVDAGRLSIICNGIDAGRIQPQDARAARRKLDLPPW